jgi:RimJ/RimL family protein N-acetyltransferase
MPPIEVRPLRPGQETVWLGMNLSPSEVEASLPDFTERVRRQHTDERSFLLAFDGPRCVGRLEGVFPTPVVCIVREIHAVEGPDTLGIEDALCAYLRPSFAGGRVSVVTWDVPESAAINDALGRAGFGIRKRKIVVERSIAGYTSPYHDPFTYSSLEVVGRESFVRIMAEASEGDPFEDSADRDVDREFQEMVDYAGKRFDPTWWTTADLGGETVGVVLPQAFPGYDDEGTLFYVGVRPAFRGRGYGKTLHAGGLEFLSRRGVTKYMGSTDERNAPMIAVFKANGCVHTATQVIRRAEREQETG